MVLVISLVVLISASIAIVSFIDMGDEASVGVFSLAATLVGTIFIAIELRNSQEVNCCEMLINLNNYFHENDKLMKIYAILEKDYMSKFRKKELWKTVEDCDVAFYCTFFENLYLLLRHKIAKITDLDDLFGYRFFLFANNPYIQEHYLLPTSSSYTQIFELYHIWKNYRDEENANEKGENHLVTGSEFALSDDYLNSKVYLHDTGFSDTSVCSLRQKEKLFTVNRATFTDIEEIMSLQDAVVRALPDKSLYCPLTRCEVIESIHLDEIYLVSRATELVALSLLVSNRVSPRNLAGDVKMSPAETMTFDVVIVDPSWRGYGLQKALVDMAIQRAKELKLSQILCTVSPENEHSYRNFTDKGFTPVARHVIKYDGKDRDILGYFLNS